MKRIIKGVLDLLIVTILVISFFAMFLGAALQTSYRYNPPTAAERAEHPILVKFLAGGE